VPQAGQVIVDSRIVERLRSISIAFAATKFSGRFRAYGSPSDTQHKQIRDSCGIGLTHGP
jgi:hypothetical protein